jgi:zinc protease
MTSGTLRHLPGRLRIETLGNGLVVCLVVNPQAPVVTSALFYRAGTRDEPAGHDGVAHFLEHMMFKGSAKYGPGEIDRITQALGGVNNAFTSHDVTAYHFNFAADRWSEALAIEVDRMVALTLDEKEVVAERQVILEEIAMYENEPWDALELAVEANLFAGHPYGRPVLGRREELTATGRSDLAAFHQRFYRPDNAVLVVAGDVDDGALEAVGKTFGRVEPAGGAGGPGSHRRAGVSPPAAVPSSLLRVTRNKGEVARLLLALPAPRATEPEHAVLRLATTLLGGGRTSRLHRALVDEEQLCVWVSADLSEGLDASQVMVAAEVVPGVEPAHVEDRVLALIAGLRESPPSPEELDRAKRVATADWVFGHEKVHQQALSVGLALTLFDLDHVDRQLDGLTAAGIDEVCEVAERSLRPEAGGVLGWSLPK